MKTEDLQLLLISAVWYPLKSFSAEVNDRLIVLSFISGIAELGIYPAVDPLDSCRILNPNIVGHEHYACAWGVQKILQDYKSLQVGKMNWWHC